MIFYVLYKDFIEDIIPVEAISDLGALLIDAGATSTSQYENDERVL